MVGVEDFINLTLVELSAKESVPVPNWEPHIVLGFAAFNERTRTIEIFRPSALRGWEKNIEITKRYLRHVLAHEFYHYLVSIGKRPLGFKVIMESKADEYGMEYSGLTADEVKDVKRQPLPNIIEKWMLGR